MYYVNIFQQFAQEQVSKRLSPSGYALFSKHCTTDYYVTQNMTHMIHVSICCTRMDYYDEGSFLLLSFVMNCHCGRNCWWVEAERSIVYRRVEMMMIWRWVEVGLTGELKENDLKINTLQVIPLICLEQLKTSGNSVDVDACWYCLVQPMLFVFWFLLAGRGCCFLLELCIFFHYYLSKLQLKHTYDYPYCWLVFSCNKINFFFF